MWWSFFNLFKRKSKSINFQPFFSLQNKGMRGVQSVAMWWLVLAQPFQTQGTHSAAQNGQKVNFTAILDRKSHFLAVLSRWVGPLGLACDVWALCNLFKPNGFNQWLRMPIFWEKKSDQKFGCGVQNGRKIDFLKKFLKFLVLQDI